MAKLAGMKTILTIIFCLAFLFVIPTHAQLKEQCATCFTSEILKSTRVDGACTDYEIKVSYSGHCDHALSHFTVAIPTCFTLSNLLNSKSCAQEIGYDPTTGLTGFKIDNTSGFGSTPEKYFTVSFRLCANNSSCGSCWKPVVAYKAGVCYELDSLNASCPSLKAHLDTKNASCFGSANGQVTAVIEDGVPPYQYSWSNGSTDSSITNLMASSYSVVIKDATGAQIILSSTVTQPAAITITPTITSASCSGQSDGAISIIVGGGNSSTYSYLWNDGNTSSSRTSLKSATYSVIVMDSLGCNAKATFNVPNQKQLTISGTTQLPSCTQSNGSISVSVSGGSEPYTFIWSNGSTSSTVSNLSAGTYSVTATDAEGCYTSATYFLRENNTLRLSYSVTPTSCLDDASGAINITVTGGVQPYSYTWSNGSTTEDIGNLTSGYYTVTVKDSAGCQLSSRVMVFKNTFQVSSIINQPKCWGDSTGTISLTPSGGISPYQFTWSNGATESSVTGLASGNYSVTITDSTGCSKLLTYSILSPTQLKATSIATSTTCNIYSIDLSVSGGTTPYTYLWSTGEQIQDIAGAAPGNYSVKITDANECIVSKEIAIKDTAIPTCSITPLYQSPVCLSSSNKIFASNIDSISYQWQIISTDGSWQIQSGSSSDTLTYTAGNPNTSATFNLTVTKNNCSQSCSYTTTTCTSSSEDGSGNNESCNDCFKSTIINTGDSESCASYEVIISTDGNCRYDLSHFVVAIPCGEITDYSDSRNWPLVIGKDPTTGLTGLKVDNVNGFGKIEGSFVLKFSVCFNSDCGEQLKNWNPVVAYKAGLCVAYDTLNISSGSASHPYPNPCKDVFFIDVSCKNDETVRVELFNQYGQMACAPMTYSIKAGEKKSIQVSTSDLSQNIYLYKVRTSTKIVTGRIFKSNDSKVDLHNSSFWDHFKK